MSQFSSGDPGDQSHPHGYSSSGQSSTQTQPTTSSVKLSAKASQPFVPRNAQHNTDTIGQKFSLNGSNANGNDQNGCSRVEQAPGTTSTTASSHRSSSATPFYPTSANGPLNSADFQVQQTTNTNSFSSSSSSSRVKNLSNAIPQTDSTSSNKAQAVYQDATQSQSTQKTVKSGSKRPPVAAKSTPEAASETLNENSDKLVQKSTKICRYFQTSQGCRQGDKCSWSHVVDGSKTDLIECKGTGEEKLSQKEARESAAPHGEKQSKFRDNRGNTDTQQRGHVTPTPVPVHTQLGARPQAQNGSDTKTRENRGRNQKQQSSGAEFQPDVGTTSSTTADHISFLLNKQANKRSETNAGSAEPGATPVPGKARGAITASQRQSQGQTGSSTRESRNKSANNNNTISQPSTPGDVSQSTNDDHNSDADLDFTTIDLDDIDESTADSAVKSEQDIKDVMQKLLNAPLPAGQARNGEQINNDDDLYGNKYMSRSVSSLVPSSTTLPTTSNRLQHIVEELLTNDYHCLICMDSITEHTYIHNCSHCNVIFHFDCIKAIAVGDADSELFKKSQKALALQRRHGKGYADNFVGANLNQEELAAAFNSRQGINRATGNSGPAQQSTAGSLNSEKRAHNYQLAVDQAVDSEYLSFSNKMNEDGYHKFNKQQQFENQRIFDDQLDNVDIDRYFNKFHGSSGNRSMMHEFMSDMLGDAKNKANINQMILTKSYACPSCSTSSSSFNLLPLCFCGHNHDTIYKTILGEEAPSNLTQFDKNGKKLPPKPKKRQLLHNNIMPHSCGHPCDRLLSESSHYYSSTTSASQDSSKKVSSDILPLFYDYELGELIGLDSSLEHQHNSLAASGSGQKRQRGTNQQQQQQQQPRQGQSIVDGGNADNKKKEKQATPSLFELYKLLLELRQNDSDLMKSGDKIDQVLNGIVDGVKANAQDKNEQPNETTNTSFSHALLPPRHKCTHRCTLICHPGPHQQCQATLTTTVLADKSHRESIQSIKCACDQPVSLFCVDVHQATQSLLLELLSKYTTKQSFSSPHQTPDPSPPTTTTQTPTGAETEESYANRPAIPPHIMQTILRLPYLQSLTKSAKPSITCGKLCQKPLRLDITLDQQGLDSLYLTLALPLAPITSEPSRFSINYLAKKSQHLQQIITQRGFLSVIQTHHAFILSFFPHSESNILKASELNPSTTKLRHNFINAVLQKILTTSVTTAVNYNNRHNHFASLHQQAYCITDLSVTPTMQTRNDSAAPSQAGSANAIGNNSTSNQHSQQALNDTMTGFVNNLHDIHILYQQSVLSLIGGSIDANPYLAEFFRWMNSPTNQQFLSQNIPAAAQLKTLVNFLQYDYNLLYTTQLACPHFCQSPCHFGICAKCKQNIKANVTNARPIVAKNDVPSLIKLTSEQTVAANDTTDPTPQTPPVSDVSKMPIDGGDDLDEIDLATDVEDVADGVGELIDENGNNSDADSDGSDDDNENSIEDKTEIEMDSNNYHFVCFCERTTSTTIPCGKASYRLLTALDGGSKATTTTELSFSCGSTCNRVLSCNHSCSYECHNNGQCPPCIWCTKEALAISPCSCAQTIVFSPELLHPAFTSLITALSPFFASTDSSLDTVIDWKAILQQQQHQISTPSRTQTRQVIHDLLFADLTHFLKAHPSNTALRSMKVELSAEKQVSTSIGDKTDGAAPQPHLVEFSNCSQRCNGRHLTHVTMSLDLHSHVTKNHHHNHHKHNTTTTTTTTTNQVIIQSTPYQCQHSCPNTCHSTACPPCLSSIERLCRCGRNNTEINCFLTNLSTFDQFTSYFQQLSSWYDQLLLKCDRLMKTAPKNVKDCATRAYDAYISLSSLSEPSDQLIIHPVYMLKYQQLGQYLTLAASQLHLPPKSALNDPNSNQTDGLTLQQHRLQSLISLSQMDSLPLISLDEKERKNFSIRLDNDQLTELDWPLFGQGWFIISSNRTFKRGDLAYALATQQYIINADQNIEYRNQQDEQIVNEKKEKQLELLQQQNRLKMERAMGLTTEPTTTTTSSNSTRRSDKTAQTASDSTSLLDLSQIDAQLEQQLARTGDNGDRNGQNAQTIVVFRSHSFVQPYAVKQPFSKFMFTYLLLPSLRYLESIDAQGSGPTGTGGSASKKKKTAEKSHYAVVSGQPQIPPEHLLLQLQPLCPRLCKQQLSCQNQGHLCNTYCCALTTHTCPQRCNKRFNCGHIHAAPCHKGECGSCTQGLMNNPVSCDCGLCLNIELASSSTPATASNKYGRITCADGEYNRMASKCSGQTHQMECIKGLSKATAYLQLNAEDVLLANLTNIQQEQTTHHAQSHNHDSISHPLTSHPLHDQSSHTKLTISLTSLIDPNINVYEMPETMSKILTAVQSFVSPVQPKSDHRNSNKKGSDQATTSTTTTSTQQQPTSAVPKSPLDQSHILSVQSIMMLKFRYIHTLVLRDQNGAFVNMLEYCESKQAEWSHLTKSMNLIPSQKLSPSQPTKTATTKPTRSQQNQNNAQHNHEQQKQRKSLANLIIPISLFDHAWFPPGHTYSFTNTSYIEQYLPQNQYRNILRQSNASQRKLRENRRIKDSIIPPGHTATTFSTIYNQNTTESQETQLPNDSACAYGPLRAQYSHLYYPTPGSALGKNIKRYYQTLDSREEIKQALQRYFPYGICSGEDGLFIGQIEAVPSAQYVEHVIAELRDKHSDKHYPHRLHSSNSGLSDLFGTNHNNDSHNHDHDGKDCASNCHGDAKQTVASAANLKLPHSMLLSDNFNIRPVSLYDYTYSTKLSEEYRIRNEQKKLKNAWRGPRGKAHQNPSTSTSLPAQDPTPMSFLTQSHHQLLDRFNQYKITLVCFPFSCNHECSGKGVCHPFACGPCYQSVIPTCSKHNNATQYLNCHNVQADFLTNGDIKLPIHCKDACNSILDCNQHFCDKYCHDGNCLMKSLHLAGTLQYVQNNYVDTNTNDAAQSHANASRNNTHNNPQEQANHSIRIAKSYQLLLDAYQPLKHSDDFKLFLTKKQFQALLTQHRLRLPSIFSIFHKAITASEYTFPLQALLSNPTPSNATIHIKSTTSTPTTASSSMGTDSKPTQISATSHQSAQSLFGAQGFELFTPTTPIYDLTVIITQLRPLTSPSSHSFALASSQSKQQPTSHQIKQSVVTALTQSPQQTAQLISQQSYLYLYALRVIRELLLLTTVNLYVTTNRFYYTPNHTLAPYLALFSTFYPHFSPAKTTSASKSSSSASNPTGPESQFHQGDHNAVYTKQLTPPSLHFSTPTTPSSFVFMHPQTAIPTLVIPLPELIDIVISLFEINTYNNSQQSTQPNSASKTNILNLDPVVAATILHIYLLIVIGNYMQPSQQASQQASQQYDHNEGPKLVPSSLTTTSSSTSEPTIPHIKAFSIPLYSAIIAHTCSQKCNITVHHLHQSNIFLSQTPPATILNSSSKPNAQVLQSLPGYHPHQCVLKCHSSTIIKELFNSPSFFAQLALKSPHNDPTLRNHTTLKQDGILLAPSPVNEIVTQDNQVSSTSIPSTAHLPSWLLNSSTHIHFPMFKEPLFINYNCRLAQSIKETTATETNGSDTTYPSVCVTISTPITRIETIEVLEADAIDSVEVNKSRGQTEDRVDQNVPEADKCVEIEATELVDDIMSELIVAQDVQGAEAASEVEIQPTESTQGEDNPLDGTTKNEEALDTAFTESPVDELSALFDAPQPALTQQPKPKVVKKQRKVITTESTTKVQQITITNKILLHFSSIEELYILSTLLHSTPAPQLPQQYHKKKVLLDLYSNSLNCTCFESSRKSEERILFGNMIAKVAAFEQPGTAFELPTLCIHQYYKLSLILQQYLPSLEISPTTINNQHEPQLSEFVKKHCTAEQPFQQLQDDFSINTLLLNDKSLSRALLLTSLVPVDELSNETNHGGKTGLNTTISLTLSLPLLFQNITKSDASQPHPSQTMTTDMNTSFNPALASFLHSPTSTTLFLSTTTSLIPLALSLLHTLHKHYNPIYPEHKQYNVTTQSLASNEAHWPYYRFDHIHDNSLLSCHSYHPTLSQSLVNNGSNIMNNVSLFPFTYTPPVTPSDPTDSTAFNSIDDVFAQMNEKKQNQRKSTQFSPPVASITTCNIFPCQHGITTSCPCGNNQQSDVACRASLFSSFMTLKYALLLSLLTTTTSPSLILQGANAVDDKVALQTQSTALQTATVVKRRVIMNQSNLTAIKLHPFIIPSLTSLLREELPAYHSQPSALSPLNNQLVYHSSQPLPEHLHSLALLTSSHHFSHTTQLPRLLDICSTYACQRQRKIATISRIMNISRFDTHSLRQVYDYVNGVKSFVVDGFTLPLWNELYGMYAGGKLNTQQNELTIKSDQHEKIIQSYFTAYRGGVLLTIRNPSDDSSDAVAFTPQSSSVPGGSKPSQIDYMHQFMAQNQAQTGNALSGLSGTGQLVSKQSLGSDGIITPYPPVFIANLSRQFPDSHIQFCENAITAFLTDSQGNYPQHFITQALSTKYRQCMYMIAELYHVTAKSFLVGQNPLEVANSITATSTDHIAGVSNNTGVTSLAAEKQMILTRTPASSLPLYTLQSAINIYKQTNQFLCCTVDSFGGFVDNSYHLRKLALQMKNRNFEQEQRDKLLDDYSKLRQKNKEEKVAKFYASLETSSAPQSFSSPLMHEFVDDNERDDADTLNQAPSLHVNDEDETVQQPVTTQSSQSNLHLGDEDYVNNLPTYGASARESTNSPPPPPPAVDDDWGPVAEPEYVPDSWEE